MAIEALRSLVFANGTLHSSLAVGPEVPTDGDHSRVPQDSKASSSSVPRSFYCQELQTCRGLLGSGSQRSTKRDADAAPSWLILECPSKL